MIISPERIAQIERRHADLAAQMGNPDLAADRFVQLSKDYAELTPVVEAAAAVRALRDDGKSLLPIGMVEVQGDFVRGDVIAVRTLAGADVARGLANYSSAEARLIARRASALVVSMTSSGSIELPRLLLILRPCASRTVPWM